MLTIRRTRTRDVDFEPAARDVPKEESDPFLDAYFNLVLARRIRRRRIGYVPQRFAELSLLLEREICTGDIFEHLQYK